MRISPLDLVATTPVAESHVELNNMSATSRYDYFSEAVAFVKEADATMDRAKKAYYKSLLESDANVIAITESFSDFAQSVKDIIDKFLKFIKRLFDKFITMLHSMVKSEQFLKNHKSDFYKFGTDDEFDFKGYRYTFKPGVPVVNTVTNFENSTSFLDKDDEQKYANVYQTQTENLDNFYDQKRAEILGRGSGQLIYDSEFADELFREFRNGFDDPEVITATSTIVTSAYNDFENYKKTERAVNTEKKNVEAQYKALKDRINNMTKKQVSNGTVTLTYKKDADTDAVTVNDNDNVIHLELLFKMEADKIQKLSDLHSLAFAAKLTALKDAFNQDKKILYQALKRMNRGFKPKTESFSIVNFGSYKACDRNIDCGDELVDFDDDCDFDCDDDFDFDVPGLEIDDDDETVIHDDDVEDVEESLFFDPGLDKLIDDTIAEGGVR